MDRDLYRSGERFQNYAVSVSEFTGFVWAEGQFVQIKVYCSDQQRLRAIVLYRPEMISPLLHLPR